MNLPQHSLQPPLDVTQLVEPPDDPGRRVRITVTRKTTDPAAGLVAIAGVLLVIGFGAVIGLSRGGKSSAQPTPPPAPAQTSSGTQIPAQFAQAKSTWMPGPGVPSVSPSQRMGQPVSSSGPQFTNMPQQTFSRTTVQPQISVQATNSGAPPVQAQGSAPSAIAATNASAGQIEVRNLSTTRMYVELSGGGSTTQVAVEPGSIGKAKLAAGSYVATVASIDPTVKPFRFQQVIEAGRTHSIPLITQTYKPGSQTTVAPATGIGMGQSDTTSDNAGQSAVGVNTNR